jgi:arylformamidase
MPVDGYDTSTGIIEDIPTVLQRLRAWSDATHTEMPVINDLRYGPSGDETLDLIVPHHGAPLLVYIHGGYWRRLHKDDSTYVARGFVPHGIAVAVINYGLRPTYTLEEITAQAVRSVAWLRAHGAEYGVDVSRMVVSGHSAGAQLAGMCAVDAHVHGVASICGLNDVRPLVHTHVNAWLEIDEPRAAALSPALLQPAGTPRVLAVAGDREDGVFAEQGRALVDAWSALGCDAAYETMEGDHFTIAQRLNDPADTLTLRIASLFL